MFFFFSKATAVVINEPKRPADSEGLVKTPRRDHTCLKVNGGVKKRIIKFPFLIDQRYTIFSPAC